MEEFLNFIISCDKWYTRCNACNCKNLCVNQHRCGESSNDCYQCIRHVHDFNNKTDRYNCDKMTYCYVLKHSYRFTFEMVMLFWKIKNYINIVGNVYVTSIGCGPCSELFGASYVWKKLQIDDSNLHFRGFELNKIWEPIISTINQQFSGRDKFALVEDVFNYYNTCDGQINIIVLDYMLSDSYKFDYDGYSVFILKLSDLISEKHIEYLLINDVYSLNSIGAINKLLSIFKSHGIQHSVNRYQYCDVKLPMDIFGDKLKKYNLPEMPNILKKYDPFHELNSIQAIIHFNWT